MNTLQIPLASFGTFVSAYAQSDFFGKLIILGLVALSVLCWVVLVQKIWQARQIEQISKTFQKACQVHRDRLLQIDVSELPKQPQGLHPFARIFRDLQEKTVEILNKNHYFSTQQGNFPEGQVYLSATDLAIVETHVLTTISAETKAMEKNLFILPTITTLAPFMGLLGTVWGILITFSELQSGGTVSSNSAMLGGLSTALSTTVLGLVIAIPALVAHSYLKTALKNNSSDMQDFLYQTLCSLEIQYRKVDLYQGRAETVNAGGPVK